MRNVAASIAGCLVCAGSINATEIVLETGIEGFQVEQPAPAELLQKLSPLLDAAGSEELRVAPVSTYERNAELIDGRGRSVEAMIWLDQFIRGTEVRQGFVLIGFNTRTKEVTLLSANFLPDRELNHLPRLTAGQAKAKAEPQLRNPRELMGFDDTPALLAYDFERTEEFGGRAGKLVWIFTANGLYSHQPYQISVSSMSGKVVRIQGREVGCFGRPPGAWTDLARLSELPTPPR
jgi:hypothetical protein